ncbi:MAG: type IX secretion system membrane protein PorP/SprF [Fluviicola sp.]|jgi:type IX secretion system PorP/SprF family membrane protein|nr:type IX secretion system membrane protein PorP/SprF [Fluviicola sp.]
MRKIVFTLLTGLSIFTVQAQQDEQSTFYMQNPLHYNPAYAGSRQSISMVALGRFQWVGFDGAPMSQWFSVHSPIANERLGIGGHFVNDNIGSRNRTAGYIDLSANIQLNKKHHRLAVGLSGGADFLSFDFTSLNVTDINDPYYGQRFNSTKPNLGAGIYYYGERHFVGISAPRLFEAKLDDANTLITNLNKRHIFFTAGGIIPLNSVVQFKPSTLIKYTPEAPITIDVNTSFLLYEKLWLGAMYRFHESVGINAMFKIKSAFQVGYSYDFPINRLVNYQKGSHEVILTYDFNFKKSIYNSPRYF